MAQSPLKKSTDNWPPSVEADLRQRGEGPCHSVGPTILEAQTRSLTWTETTRMEVPGSLGMIMRMAGAADPITTRSAMHLQGNVLIHEADETTIVTDLDAGRWLNVDHATRTYMSMTFADLQQMSEEAVAEVQAATADADLQASQEELRRSQEEAQAEIEFRISAESTGQRQRIGSVNASQHFIIAEFETTSVPEGVEDEPEGGSIYFLTELWQTSDVPGEEEMLQVWARALSSNAELRETVLEMTQSAQESGEVLATALAAWNRLSQEQFSSRFRKSPVKRAKRRGLLRNVAVALGNWWSSEGVSPLLAALHDDEPLIRGHAAWALGRIAGTTGSALEVIASCRGALEERLAVEPDEWVAEELLLALDDLSRNGESPPA